MSNLRLAAELRKLDHHGAANVERVKDGRRGRGITQRTINYFGVRIGELRLLGTSRSLAHGAASTDGFQNPAPHFHMGVAGNIGRGGKPASVGTGQPEGCPAESRPLKA